MEQRIQSAPGSSQIKARQQHPAQGDDLSGQHLKSFPGHMSYLLAIGHLPAWGHALDIVSGVQQVDHKSNAAMMQLPHRAFS
ncbi:hypothetical protein SAZ10_32585 [Mesorhizobium sp. BAC0120]|uniref:hypothetical protein n=1 Tax=Mesorhizobium sp. BAC0120 TaxID=3090670 RepID=UPI00298CEDCF|nr:hypothetical protein [Mesorhizobium sp. BAC0120]MDW6026509.1 hypothetical protein [Mesorhizobium sp. BAC0120]